MKRQYRLLGAALIPILFAAAPAFADTLRSAVAFNNGIGQPTASQPTDGKEVAYEIVLSGGDLDGCTVSIVESLYGRDGGAWGIFDIAGDVTCADGSFSYTTSGAWDGNGFHAAGEIVDGSGAYEGIKGRVAQLGGAAADAGDGTYNLSYDLVVDRVD